MSRVTGADAQFRHVNGFGNLTKQMGLDYVFAKNTLALCRSHFHAGDIRVAALEAELGAQLVGRCAVLDRPGPPGIFDRLFVDVDRVITRGRVIDKANAAVLLCATEQRRALAPRTGSSGG